MQRFRLIALVTMLLTGCATASFDVPTSDFCPPIVTYKTELQQRAAAELEALPQDAALRGMMRDYSALRRMLRACHGRPTN